MATWDNGTKSSTTFANDSKGSVGLTWNEADFTWDSATDITWDAPFIPFSNASKSSTSFTNETKN